MKLYHGSIEIVRTPEIRTSNRTLDYGYGFYATTSCEQAEEWVKRRARQQNSTIGYVNIYEFHMDALMDLNALLFDVPSEEWIDFVMKNRIQKDFTHNYDIVYGPVANDRVYAAFTLYEGGLIDKQNLISELKTYKLVDQYLFHTDKALKTLSFIDALEITL